MFVHTVGLYPRSNPWNKPSYDPFRMLSGTCPPASLGKCVPGITIPSYRLVPDTKPVFGSTVGAVVGLYVAGENTDFWCIHCNDWDEL